MNPDRQNARVPAAMTAMQSAAILMVTCLMCPGGGACAQSRGQTVQLVRTTGWRHVVEGGPMDFGHGVISFRLAEGTTTDTIPLFVHPGDTESAGFVALVLDAMGGVTWTVAWPERLTTNVIEFDYERAGLPFDSVAPGEWIRVIPGFATAGSASAGGGATGAGDNAAVDTTEVRAWARLRPDRLDLVRWTDELPRHDLFFAPGIEPAFFGDADGRAVPFRVPVEGDDYIMYPVRPLEMHGEWMRVRVVTPSDMCGDPVGPRSAVVWIRFLDGIGRPRTWYHTRGC